MIARFNLYDFLADLIPGLVLFWCINLLLVLLGWHLPFDSAGGLAGAVVVIALGYLAGLMLQAVSEQYVQKLILLPLWNGFPSARWLLPDNSHFSQTYKTRLLALMAERFQISTEPEIPAGSAPEAARVLQLKKNDELFFLCYRYVDSFNPRPQIFNALYGLFRSLIGLFGMLCVLSLTGVVVTLICGLYYQVAVFLLLAGISGFCAWLSYGRCKRRSEDFARCVYDLFVIGVTGS
jgi:hypothetical protein